ncbi:MAG: MarR family transcriptional regulator [Hyphomicrobiales bacterium]|nr:MAG: MarR family transcriptional regulator [Hyphomicrobiales bacterium]
MLDDPPKTRLGPALILAQEHWRRAVEQVMAAQGAPPIWASVEVLARLTPEGVSQALLAERMGLSKQAVQQFLDQLEALALIRRESDPADKRAKRVFITEAGMVALTTRREAERQADRQMRDILGRKNFDRLKKALGKLSAAPASTPG